MAFYCSKIFSILFSFLLPLLLLLAFFHVFIYYFPPFICYCVSFSFLLPGLQVALDDLALALFSHFRSLFTKLCAWNALSLITEGLVLSCHSF